MEQPTTLYCVVELKINLYISFKLNLHLEKTNPISLSGHLLGIGLASEHMTLTIDPVKRFSEINLIFCEYSFCL